MQIAVLPITMEEWEKGRTATTLESRLEVFLFQNKGKAFTLAELANMIYDLKSNDSRDVMESVTNFFNIGEALKLLMREGKVRSKLIKGANCEDVYYTSF